MVLDQSADEARLMRFDLLQNVLDDFHQSLDGLVNVSLPLLNFVEIVLVDLVGDGWLTTEHSLL